MPMRLPVRVRGREANGTAWEEVTSCLDVCQGGVGIVMTRPVSTGQVLHLSVPLPMRYRQYDLVESSYRVYALVRNTGPSAGGSRVGVVFLGRHQPRGGDPLPSELYLMPGERLPRHPRPLPSLRLRLDAEQAPGGVAQEEETVAEHLAPRTALVKLTRLPVSRGSVLGVEEVDGAFRSRAEVSSISIGADGQPRLGLRLLDAPVPDRLLPGSDRTDDS
jgi:hypothetical protein